MSVSMKGCVDICNHVGMAVDEPVCEHVYEGMC